MSILRAIYRWYSSHFISRFTSEMEEYSKYKIGEWTYGKPKVLSWGEGTTLKIGRFCSISYGVTILLGGEHNLDWVTTYPFSEMYDNAREMAGHPKSRGDVIIGNDVWIGREAIILSGVNIGNGAVIGARSVVTKDIAPYSIVAGNPARLIRFRFDEAVINDLQNIAWWNWPIENIKEALPMIFSPNIDEFIKKYKKYGQSK